MFRSAYLRLTTWYLLIIMTISLFFSGVLYQGSVRELRQGLHKQIVHIQDRPGHFGPEIDFEEIESDQLAESQRRLRLGLLYFNLSILILAGLASYALAKLTLQPIEDMMAALSRFTADASHELRTPLTAMKTEIEVSLRDKNLKVSEARQLLRSNLEEINKLERLSNDLLMLARYEESKPIFENSSLLSLIEEAYDRVLRTASQRNIDIVLEVQDCELKVDPTSFIELLVVLLDNAVKYSPAESKVTVNATYRSNAAVIKIIDEGPGISEDDLPHIFDRFYRSDTSRSKEATDGYGLGLAIAQQIAKLHRGQITVASSVGEGTTFTVTVPLH